MMMEAEKSHDLPSANWRIKRLSNTFPPKPSPKAREAEKSWYSSWTILKTSDLRALILRGRRNVGALVQTESEFTFCLPFLLPGSSTDNAIHLYRWGQCFLLSLLIWTLSSLETPSKTHLEIVLPAFRASLNPGKLLLEKSTIVSPSFLNLVSASLDYTLFQHKEQRSHNSTWRYH